MEKIVSRKSDGELSWPYRASSRKYLVIITGVVIIAVAAILIYAFRITSSTPRPAESAVDQAECARISEKMRCELCTLTDDEKRTGRLCLLEKNKTPAP